MTADAAGVAHAAAGDDDGARGDASQCPAFLERLDEAHVGRAQVGAEMAFEDLCGADGQRRIEKDLKGGDLLPPHQGGQIEQKLLCPFDGEGGDQQIAAGRHGGLHLRGQGCLALGFGNRLAVAVAIGRLDDEVVDVFRRGGIGMERLVSRAKVAREQEA